MSGNQLNLKLGTPGRRSSVLFIVMCKLGVMAHQPIQPWEIDEIEEQRKVREQAGRVFGREPESVQFQKTGSSVRGVACFVRMRFGSGKPVEFIFVNRALLGIPPKRRW